MKQLKHFQQLMLQLGVHMEEQLQAVEQQGLPPRHLKASELGCSCLVLLLTVGGCHKRAPTMLPHLFL
jgi:hypothetical protein